MRGSREQLVGRQALIREVNERIKGLADPLDGRLHFVCECGDARCSTSVALTPAEYERLRTETTWLLVAAGHEPPEIARVVDARGGFTIVEVR